MWFRFVIAFAILAPVMIVEPHRPWWLMFVITFAAFGAGRLMEGGIDAIGKAQTRRRGIAMLVGGLVVAAVALGPVLIAAWQRHHAVSETIDSPSGVRLNRSHVDAAVPPQTPPVHRPGTWRAIAMADRTACAVRDDGTAWCWGRVPIFGNAERAEPQQVEGVAGATAISVGDMSACALVDRQAWCFGWNYTAAIGVPATDTHDLRTAPVRVPIAAPLTAVSVGTGHACALTETGAVWCWGTNDYGQVGIAPTSEHDYRPPTRVIGVPAARALAAGRDATCAIARDDARVWCWGDRELHGSLGGGDRPKAPPTAMAGLDHATAIAVSDGQGCALVRDGDVMCWGMGSLSPTMHPGSDTATAIAVGEVRVCTARASDTRCWPFLRSAPAKAIADLPALDSLATSELESCGLTATGELWCWDHRTSTGLLDRPDE